MNDKYMCLIENQVEFVNYRQRRRIVGFKTLVMNTEKTFRYLKKIKFDKQTLLQNFKKVKE